MTKANLAIARKIVLYTGLLVAGLLLAYPHWILRVHPGNGTPPVSRDIGRAFIATPPVLTHMSSEFHLIDDNKPVRIDYVRQFAEVAFALAFTFAVMSALRKTAED